MTNESAYVNDKYSRAELGTNGQKVYDIEDLHSKWLDADSPNRERMFSSLDAFVDVNGSSWPAKDRAELKRQGRHPVSFNIAEQKLNSLAGNMRSQKWDFSFSPMNLKHTSLINNIKYWYYADKEQYNYSESENKCLLYGLMYCGYEEMEIRYDIRPSGAIGFFANLPGTVLEDPYWQSDLLRDWRRAMKDAWMTAEDIIEKFETDDADIRRYAMTHVSSAQQYEPLGDLRIWQDAPYEWGSKLLVTEYRWLEKIKTTRLYLKLPDRWFPLPIKAKENEVREYMQYFGIDSWEMVREFPYEDDVLQVCTICPQASRTAILAEGKHPIQCKSIGFFPFSYIREMGVKKGIMESMLDLNRTLNYRESKKDDIIASGAAGGLVIDKTKLGPEPQKVMEELKQNRTRPDFVLGVEGNIKDAIGGLPTSQVPNEIWQDIASLVDMFDRVSPVTPALEGRSTADESGIAFEMRHAVTKLSTLILYDSWQQHLMDKAEGWYNQAQITYKGIYRQVKNTDTGEIVEFNAPTYENGIKGYLNSIEDLPRSNIIVSLSKESPTEQFATRVRMYDLTKILSAHPELFQEEIQTLIYKIMQTEEMLPEERVEMNQMMNLKKLRNMLNLLSQTKGAEGQLLNNQTIVMQAQQMLQQMMQQQEQQMQAQQGQQAPQQISPETQMPQGSPAGPGPGGGPSAEMPLPGEAEGEPGQPVQTIRGEFNPGL